jgi:hypothetical protein
MKTFQFSRKFQVSAALGILVIAGLVSGCGSTMQARKATPSGFLGDYSQLTQGDEGEALLRYVNPKVNFAKYNKILMMPVQVYAGKDSKIAKIPREDLRSLVNYLDATMREHLKTDYTFVDVPGPGVMKLQLAITEAHRSIVLLDVASSIGPPGVALSALKQVATGSPSATGSVGGECQAVDSVTGERLFAAVDARVGQKYTGKFDKFNTWRASQGAFDYWAEQLQQQLREHRKQSAR